MIIHYNNKLNTQPTNKLFSFPIVDLQLSQIK